MQTWMYTSPTHTYKNGGRGYPVGAGTYSAGTDTTDTADTAAAGAQKNKPLEDAIDCGAVEPGSAVFSSKEHLQKYKRSPVSGVLQFPFGFHGHPRRRRRQVSLGTRECT